MLHSIPIYNTTCLRQIGRIGMIIAFSTTSRFCASCLENCCLLLFMLLHHERFLYNILKRNGLFCPKRQITPIPKKLNVKVEIKNKTKIRKYLSNCYKISENSMINPFLILSIYDITNRNS